jgi:hypothetical protein
MVVRSRFGLLSAVAVVSLISGCGQASKPATHAPSPGTQVKRSATTWQHQPPGKPAGEAAAQALLDAAVLLPGAQRLTSSPSSALDQPFTTVADDNFLDRPAWWKVNLSADETVTYLQTHPPAGLISSGSGGGVSGPGQPTIHGLTFGPASPFPGNPALQYSVVAASDRSSWVRADGQTIWYPPRPAAETAPTAGVVTVSVSRGPTRKVTDPASVQRLATELNRLIPSTPSKSSGVSCPPNVRTLSIAFAKTGAPHPVVVATTTACSVSWNVRGPSGDLPALDGGVDLRADALRLLGLPANAF